jgi:hypothetical protein
MKKYLKILFLVSSLIIFNGCKSITNILVEKDYILAYKLIEVYENEADFIIISGLIGHSSYNYKTIKIIDEDQTKKLFMYAELSVLNKKGSGDFNITIPIEKNINKVMFGNNNEVIWERKTAEKLAQREKILKLKKFTNYNDIVNQFGEPDDDIGSGFLIIQYTLNNNRRAILNFGAGKEGLLQLTEVFGYKDTDINKENMIFGFKN